MIFENTQVQINNLPAVKQVHFQQLDRAFLKVEYISSLIFFGFLFFVIFIFVMLASSEVRWVKILVASLWLFWFMLSLLLVKKNYDIAGYAIRQHDIVHRKGVVFRNLTTIPFNRIQHCEISEGPVEKLFELSTLKVFTAGGATSDLAIGGIRKEEAQLIKEFITRKIGAHDEEE